MRRPPLGKETVWVKHCTREVGDGHCTRDATVHLRWDAAGENSLACDEHFAEARKWDILDVHEVGPVCSMPGAMWDVERKRCYIEGIDESVPELAVAQDIGA